MSREHAQAVDEFVEALNWSGDEIKACWDRVDQQLSWSASDGDVRSVVDPRAVEMRRAWALGVWYHFQVANPEAWELARSALRVGVEPLELAQAVCLEVFPEFSEAAALWYWADDALAAGLKELTGN